MAGHQALPAPPAPSSLSHLLLPFAGQVQTQAMSHAKFIFLIALVVFFIVLFVVAYVWMRRPEFGQKGGHPISTTSAGPLALPARRVAGKPRTEHEVATLDAPRMAEGRAVPSDEVQAEAERNASTMAPM
jgi:hypothetical protein